MIVSLIVSAGVAPLLKWNHGDFARNRVCGRGEMTKPTVKRIIRLVLRFPLPQERVYVVFLEESRGESKILLTVSTTLSRTLLRTDAQKTLSLSSRHCHDASGKLGGFTEATWQRLKEMPKFDVFDNLSSSFDFLFDFHWSSSLVLSKRNSLSVSLLSHCH